MGIPTIGPDDHVVLVRIPVALPNNVRKCRETSLDLSKVALSNLVPRGFLRGPLALTKIAQTVLVP